MPIYNVTTTSLDHECVAHNLRGERICYQQRAGLPHSEVKIVDAPDGKQIQIVCPDGHIECFHNALAAWEETSPTRDEASREQVRNVRALYKHLGLAQ